MEAFLGLVAAGVVGSCLVLLGVVPFFGAVVTGAANVLRPSAGSKRWGVISGGLAIVFGAFTLFLELQVAAQVRTTAAAVAGVYALAGMAAVLAAVLAKPGESPRSF